MSHHSADWHLLFGLLALQNGIISRPQLVAAFAKWTSEKSLRLDQILVADQVVDPNVSATLKQLVELHIQGHGGNPQESLLALSGSDLPSVKADLLRLDDQELHQSIAIVPDSYSAATLPHSMGQSTSSGRRFRVLRPLPGAEGGMGKISVADDEELGRQVALKQIRGDKADNEYFRRKFQIEAEITGNLEHPSIVPVYGLGKDADGRPYYAMRLVYGDNLAACIKRCHNGARPVDYASVEFHVLIDRLLDVAQAVRYAHSRGVLHRDLKPGNILVGEYGETLVIDWGLARLPHDEETEQTATDEGIDGKSPLHIRSGSDADKTNQGGQLGTVGYAPPEQLNGRVDLISERSDVYGLGAILYQILTGESPVGGRGRNRDVAASVRDTIEGIITPPTQFNRLIPKALSAICLKALRREPAERYESVAAFIEDIDRWKADQPVSAAPDSLADRATRLIRRHRNGALGAAVTLLAITLVTSIAVLLINQARHKAEKLAEEKSELAQRNQTVVDNFVAAFRSPDPENEGVTSKMTALEVLQQALKQIESDEELSKDELTKATLMQAIALSLHSLGEYTHAISACEETLGLHKAKLGAEHPETLTSVNNLAYAYQAAGRRDEALPLFEEALRICQAKLGAEHPDTLISLNNLASAYQDAGRLDEALPLLEQTFGLLKAKLGTEHPHTLTSMNNLASAYQEAGRLDEALPLSEEALRLRQAKLGAEHPDTLTSMNNLASTYQDAGQLDDSLPLYEEALGLHKAKLGTEHPDTLNSLNNLAYAYHAAGRLDEALPLYEEALGLHKAKLGTEHPHTLTSMNNLAYAYKDAGRLDEALPHYEEALRLCQAKLGAEHPDTLTSMNNLASAYQDAGRLDEALPLYEETLRLFKAQLGAEHPDTVTSINNLASAYRAAGRLDEALPLYEETLRLFKAKLGAEHPNTLISMGNLAGAYQAAGRLDEALPLSEEALRLCQAKLGAEHPRTLINMGVLAGAYRAAGRLDEALPLLEEALRLFKARLGEEHPGTLTSMGNLAIAYQDAGRLDEALPLLEESLHLRQAKLGAEHPRTLISMGNLAWAYLEVEDFGAAQGIAGEWIRILEQSAKSDRAQIAEVKTVMAEALLGKQDYTNAKLQVDAALNIEQIEDRQRLGALSIKGTVLASESQWEEAEPLLVDSANALIERLSGMKNHRWYVPRACERVIAMYEAWGKPEEAAKWRTKLASVNAEIERPAH